MYDMRGSAEELHEDMSFSVKKTHLITIGTSESCLKKMHFLFHGEKTIQSNIAFLYNSIFENFYSCFVLLHGNRFTFCRCLAIFILM